MLDILVQRRRDTHAAKTFFRKLLKGLAYVPRVIITDQLKSYGAAKREILPSVEHRQHRYLNNRAENSHQPTRQRERRMQRFKSQDTRNGFSPPMDRSPNTSGRGATSSQPGVSPGDDATISGLAGGDGDSGSRIRAAQSVPPPPWYLVIVARKVNLTVPLKMINIDHQQP